MRDYYGASLGRTLVLLQNTELDTAGFCAARVSFTGTMLPACCLRDLLVEIRRIVALLDGLKCRTFQLCQLRIWICTRNWFLPYIHFNRMVSLCVTLSLCAKSFKSYFKSLNNEYFNKFYYHHATISSIEEYDANEDEIIHRSRSSIWPRCQTRACVSAVSTTPDWDKIRALELEWVHFTLIRRGPAPPSAILTSSIQTDAKESEEWRSAALLSLPLSRCPPGSAVVSSQQ